MLKVLGDNGSVIPDGLVPYAIYNFFIKEMKSILDPKSTNTEYFQGGAPSFKSVKIVDKVADVPKILRCR